MQITNKFRKEEICNTIVHEGIEYTREEAIMNDDFHTIAWYTGSKDDDTYELREYYTKEIGWSDETGHLNKKVAVPPLELLYRELTAK